MTCNALPRGATPSTVQPTSCRSAASLAAPGQRNVHATRTLSRDGGAASDPRHGVGQSRRAGGGLGQVQVAAQDPADLEPRQPRLPQVGQVAPEVGFRGREQRDRVVEDPRTPPSHHGKVGLLDRLGCGPASVGSAAVAHPASRAAPTGGTAHAGPAPVAGRPGPVACRAARRAVACRKSARGQCRWSKSVSTSPTNARFSPTSVSSRADSRARSPPNEYPSSWYGPCGCSARMMLDRLGGQSSRSSLRPAPPRPPGRRQASRR